MEDKADKSYNDDDDEDSGDDAWIAATQSQRKGRGHSPPPYGSYGFPLHQPTQATQWSQTQATLIPTQAQLSQGVPGPFGLPQNVGRNLAGIQMDQSAHYARANPTAAAPSKKKAKQGGGRKAGSKGYTQEETMYLLELMEEHIPIGTTAWETIARLHNEIFCDVPRSRDSLKRLYQGLLRKKTPTGDPHCPPDVKKAKEIERLIAARTRAGDISEENGGAMAALAGMEIDTKSSSSNTLEGTQALSAKRASPRMQSQQSFIEQVMAWQMMQSQQMNAQRELDRQQNKREQRQNKMMMQMMMMNQQMQMAAMFGKKPEVMKFNMDDSEDEEPTSKKPRTEDDIDDEKDI